MTSLYETLERHNVFRAIVAGSHLYNLATKSSDLDYIAVSPTITKNMHIIAGEHDITIWSVNNFRKGASKGVEQIAQLLYAQPEKIIVNNNNEWRSYIMSTRCDAWRLRTHLLRPKENQGKEKILRENARRAIVSLILCATGKPEFSLNDTQRAIVARAMTNKHLYSELLELANSTMIGENQLGMLYSL